MTAVKKQAEDDTDRAKALYEAYLRGKADMYAQMIKVFEEQRPGR